MPRLCALSEWSRSGSAGVGLCISDAQLFFKVTLKPVIVEIIRYSDSCSEILFWYGLACVSLLNGLTGCRVQRVSSPAYKYDTMRYDTVWELAVNLPDANSRVSIKEASRVSMEMCSQEGEDLHMG